MRFVLLLLITAGCGDAVPADDAVDGPACTPREAREKFQELVLPLIATADSSCSACHVNGTHLREFVQDTACGTMACLEADGLADFSDPSASEILAFVQRGRDKDDPMVRALADKEFENLAAWLDYAAQCRPDACGDIEYACEDPDPCDAQHDESCGSIIRDRPDPSAIVDYGCDEAELARAFYDYVLPWRGRCDHCHEPGGALSDVGDPPPPPWLDADDSHEGAARTIANLRAAGLIHDEFPGKSLLLAKPLHEDLSGVTHGGGTKFGDQTDETYQDIFAWLYHDAGCR